MYRKMSLKLSLILIVMCQMLYGSYMYKYSLGLSNTKITVEEFLKIKNVLQKRLSYIGCNEITFSSDESNKLFVEFKHENSISPKIEKLIIQQGNFEMKLLYKPNELKNILRTIDTVANSSKLKSISNNEFTIYDYLHPYKEVHIGVEKQYKDLIDKIVNKDIMKEEMLRRGIKCDVLWDYLDLHSNNHDMYGIYFVKRNVSYTFDGKSKANIIYSLINNLSIPSIEVKLGEKDRRMFARIAKIYNTYFLAIIMDNMVFQAPTVSRNMKIDSFIMTYQIPKDNAEIISCVFNSGPLIYPVKITSKKIFETED